MKHVRNVDAHRKFGWSIDAGYLHKQMFKQTTARLSQGYFKHNISTCFHETYLQMTYTPLIVRNSRHVFIPRSSQVTKSLQVLSRFSNVFQVGVAVEKKNEATNMSCQKQKSSGWKSSRTASNSLKIQQLSPRFRRPSWTSEHPKLSSWTENGTHWEGPHKTRIKDLHWFECPTLILFTATFQKKIHDHFLFKKMHFRWSLFFPVSSRQKKR